MMLLFAYQRHVEELFMNPFDLSGQVAMVTGTSGGLGQGMAVGLAEAALMWCWFPIPNLPKRQVQLKRWDAKRILLKLI